MFSPGSGTCVGLRTPHGRLVTWELRRYQLVLGYPTVPRFLELYGAGLPEKLRVRDCPRNPCHFGILFGERSRVSERSYSSKALIVKQAATQIYYRVLRASSPVRSACQGEVDQTGASTLVTLLYSDSGPLNVVVEPRLATHHTESTQIGKATDPVFWGPLSHIIS